MFAQLARVIATQSLTPHPGHCLYVDSRSNCPSQSNGTCVTLATKHRQIWIGADGSGLLRETIGPANFTSTADRAACRGLPTQTLFGSTRNSWFAAQCLSLGPSSDWRSLSRDPLVLLRQMRQLDGGPRTAGEDFVHIGDFLRETDAPPAVRAIIYRAAALIRGIRLLGSTRDHDDRRQPDARAALVAPDHTIPSAQLGRRTTAAGKQKRLPPRRYRSARCEPDPAPATPDPARA